MPKHLEKFDKSAYLSTVKFVRKNSRVEMRFAFQENRFRPFMFPADGVRRKTYHLLLGLQVSSVDIRIRIFDDIKPILNYAIGR